MPLIAPPPLLAAEAWVSAGSVSAAVVGGIPSPSTVSGRATVGRGNLILVLVRVGPEEESSVGSAVGSSGA